jgi:hypothetical protein
MKSKDARE